MFHVHNLWTPNRVLESGHLDFELLTLDGTSSIILNNSVQALSCQGGRDYAVARDTAQSITVTGRGP